MRSQACFPARVVSEGLQSATDVEVWEHAARGGLVIATKEADFHQRSFLLGAPPKVVWVRLGNCTTGDVARLLRERIPDSPPSDCKVSH